MAFSDLAEIWANYAAGPRFWKAPMMSLAADQRSWRVSACANAGLAVPSVTSKMARVGGFGKGAGARNEVRHGPSVLVACGRTPLALRLMRPVVGPSIFEFGETGA